MYRGLLPIILLGLNLKINFENQVRANTGTLD